MKETAVVHPSDTFMFGEKKNEPTPADWTISWTWTRAWAMIWTRSSRAATASPAKASNSGGSNFAFVDGSARYMRYGSTVWPLNLWAVNDTNRLVYAWKP